MHRYEGAAGWTQASLAACASNLKPVYMCHADLDGSGLIRLSVELNADREMRMNIGINGRFNPLENADQAGFVLGCECVVANVHVFDSRHAGERSGRRN